METLLRLKHWQIFLLTFGVIFVGICAMMAASFSDTIDFDIATRVTTMIVLVGACIENAWLYMIATVFYKKYPEEVTMNLGTFKVCFWYIVFYQVAGMIVLPILNLEQGPLDKMLTYVSYVASVYVAYAVAKVLQLAERQKTDGFPTGDFFAFLFYPIGVWFLQPRINNLFDNELVVIDPDAPLDQSVR
jgi:hypothetical protein